MLRSCIRNTFIGVLALTSALLAQAAPKEINFGIISTESSQNLRTQWEPFLADMSARTGIKFKPFFASDYAGIIQGMRFKKVDIAWYGNKAAIEAVDRANGEVFAQTVNSDGSTGYYSLLITQKDSPYHNIQDMLKNAAKITFGNGDPNSTSGYLVPGYYVFAKNHVDPAKIFKRTLNSNHESNALAVANRQIDIATFNTENWDKLKAAQPDKIAKLKVIWKSPLIPSDPLVWRKDLDAETRNKLRAFLLSYGKTPTEKKVLSALGWKGFRSSTNAQLQPIRQLEAYKNSAAKN